MSLVPVESENKRVWWGKRMSERDRIQKLETRLSNLTYELTCTNHLLFQALQRVNRLAPGFISEEELAAIQKQQERVKSLLKQQQAQR